MPPALFSEAAHTLEPAVVLIMGHYGEAVPHLVGMLNWLRRPAMALACTSSKDERTAFSEAWPDSLDLPLLMLHSPVDKKDVVAIRAVLDLAQRKVGHPIVVLVADGPEVPGFKKSPREEFCRGLAAGLSGMLPDVQVFLYSPSWMSHPPRIR